MQLLPFVFNDFLKRIFERTSTSAETSFLLQNCPNERKSRLLDFEDRNIEGGRKESQMQGTSSRNVGRDAINAFNEIVRGGLINLFPCARHKSWGLPPSLLDYTEGGGRGEGEDRTRIKFPRYL